MLLSIMIKQMKHVQIDFFFLLVLAKKLFLQVVDL